MVLLMDEEIDIGIISQIQLKLKYSSTKIDTSTNAQGL